MKKQTLIAALTLFSVLIVSAETCVWKAEKDGSTLYFGGSFHILREADFPLPSEFDTAYAASDLLVLETDMAAMKSMETQQKIMAAAMYTDGTTLKDHLSAETFQKIVDLCEAKGIRMAAIQRLKPSMAILTISMTELLELGVIGEGPDTFFHKKALADKKPLEYFETVDEQISMLFEMGMDDPEAFVSYSLKDLESTKQDYLFMLNAWKIGDASGLEHFVIEKLDEFPGLYKEMIVDRNKAWLEKIPAWQQTPETEFILVGAAHLIGPDGLLAVLEKDGWDITKLDVPSA